MAKKLSVLGLLLTLSMGPDAVAGILRPGVFLISQDIMVAAAGNQWMGTDLVSFDKYASGNGPSRLVSVKAETTVRMGFKRGLMFDASLGYERDRLSTAWDSYSAGQFRGGTTHAKFGFMKQICTVLGDASAAPVTDSAIGDVEVLGGISVPTRKREDYDFYNAYDGEYKASFGVRHTYYAPWVNPETVIVGFARNKLPAQLFAQFKLNLHWEANPIEWFRYSTLSPTVSLFNTFGGKTSGVSNDFMQEWTETGAPPFLKLNTKFAQLGVTFFHPFNYVFFMEARFNRVIAGRNMLQSSEFGFTLSHLF